IYPGDRIPDMFQDDSEIISHIFDYSKTNTPKKFIEIKKLLLDTILPTKGKAIIWTIFIYNSKELHEYLYKHEITSKMLIGEIEQSRREEIIAKFNNPDNKDFEVIIANPYAVSESISLHMGCHNAIYLERDYNCSNYLQSKDRIHRYGLPSNQITNYYYMISKKSIDSVINDKLVMKVKRMEKIIDEDIPLFFRINDSDESDLIKALMNEYDRRA
ncbi:MAG: helicase-related protein, partial [Candidatus Taylorbacteria bacterium]|nr:helicase-related protein [Candidatus Taylorbacteria bacterium]